MARRVAGRLALDRVVGVFESSAVTVPVMIGWMKPVVLLPAAALAGLSMMQVEALLAHELAHVRRHDYLVNLLQSAVETLLFYHPAVWFISRRMRIDREHCCDDLAVHVCDRVVYATALSDLAAMATTPRVALAATDGPLLQRVRRILGQPAEGHDGASGWLSVCMVVLLVGSIAPVALTQDKKPDAAKLLVDSSVAGGVQGGVVGGVPGGVPGGVVGGVPGGVVGGVEQAVEVKLEQVAEQAQADPKAEQRVLEAQLRELEAERQKLAQARMEIELRRTQTQSEAKIATQEVQMKALRLEWERARKMVDAGTANATVLAELEARIAASEQQMRAERAEMEFQRADMDLRKQELALEREALIRQKLFEVLPELKEFKEKTDKEFKATLENEKVRKDLEKVELIQKLEEAQKLDELKLKLVIEERLPENETARAGDIVQVAIPSEPALPPMYKVQSDGTIRFPFLGSIKVQGLTARQVQEALAKQFDRLNLPAPGMHVSFHRIGKG